MNTHSQISWWAPALAFTLTSLPAFSGPPPLTVVRDLGGVLAQPYYEALRLHPQVTTPAEQPALPAPHAGPTHTTPERWYRESDLLPVRSARLTPGTATARILHALGLTPMFLIGTDASSEMWLLQHAQALRTLHAVGFVVNVESLAALESLRRRAPGLNLSPASGDELARRLHLEHYPVLITATGIEP